jgi:ATP-dependent exoDNAse (exonuclease V) beta subunit
MPAFKVIRASAGSGKTFNLTREYLILLFTEQEAFRHILAVTFTNKATEEMKSRIIHELYALANDEPSNQLPGIISITGYTERQIRSKALVILKKILHHYSGFNVKTIDSFFQSIIRNFTRELGIQEGYTIELDTELVLSESINRLLIQAEHDKALLSWLTQFAESLIEKGESWNLRRGIYELGKEIFGEPFKGLSTDVLTLFSDREYLNHYRIGISSVFHSTANTYKEFGKRALAIINSGGLVIDDFNNKNRGPAGFLISLASSGFKAPTATAIEAATTKEKWYTASSSKKEIVSRIAETSLMPLMQEAIDFYNSQHQKYYTSSVILKNLYTLGILSDLSAIADAWCSENNIFLLTEASGFLNKIIDGNDTPFIYEKAGFWFHHFMMDEFQDTSIMQWMNFKPLISNSLSQDFDNLAVGDTKQSIYRWRNSNWEILESRIGKDFPSGITVPITLRENWRSKTNIIEFNNHFFRLAAAILQEEIEKIPFSVTPDDFQPITEIYREMEQIPGRSDNTGGIVKLDFISNASDEEFREKVNTEIIHLIYDLLDKGYRLNDIAILTRKNKEAAQLADFILNYRHEQNLLQKLEVISDEALLLGSSMVVSTVVSGFRYIVQPNERTNNYYLESVYRNYLDTTETDEIWGTKSLPEEFKALAHSKNAFSLSEVTEQIISIFNLGSQTGELAYLMAFRDLVNDYTSKNGSNITGFLEYWDETGKYISVSAPAGQDAIRIVTLHKSKGLEYKITIIPYCNWELNTMNKGFLWCKPNSEPFNKMPVLPLIFNRQLEQTIFSEDFYREMYKQYVDNLNLLYVAFTRAKDGLFIFCKDHKDDQLRNVADLARKVLGKANYVSGELKPDSGEKIWMKSDGIQFNQYSTTNPSARLKIAFQGNLIFDPQVQKPKRPVSEGKILHEIFTLIKTREDVKTAVMRLHQQGKIASVELDRYIDFIEHSMNDIQVSTWFTEAWTIMNEAEIILPGGEIKRPDRVMRKGNQVIVIDYKFGSRLEPKNEIQIKEYAGILQQMGYSAVEAYLWYVKLGRVVQIRHIESE